METVYENWFDYEIGGKVPLSLLESQFNEELNNFSKILEAIDVCDENSITVSINENAITDKIRELWGKFKTWWEGILNTIKSIVTDIKTKIAQIARQKEAFKNLDWEKLAEDYDKRCSDFIQSNQDVIDADYVVVGESTSIVNEGLYKGQFLGFEMNGHLITDSYSVINDLDKIYDSDALLRLAKSLTDAVANPSTDNINNLNKELDFASNITNTRAKNIKRSIKGKFEPKYEGNPKGYHEYLWNHIELIGKAIGDYQATIDSLEKEKKMVDGHMKSFKDNIDDNKALFAIQKAVVYFTRVSKDNIKSYKKLISILKYDMSLSLKLDRIVTKVELKLT